MLLRIGCERRDLVVEDLLRIVQQTPDQRRLAVIDRPAGDEAQDVLAAMGAQECIEAEFGRAGLGSHQK
jgi:hypothetical protein